MDAWHSLCVGGGVGWGAGEGGVGVVETSGEWGSRDENHRAFARFERNRNNSFQSHFISLSPLTMASRLAAPLSHRSYRHHPATPPATEYVTISQMWAGIFSPNQPQRVEGRSDVRF
jgi:hypothetical protein